MAEKLGKLMAAVVLSGIILTGIANAGDLKLVGWWRFDEDFGNVATDSSGNGRNGTIVGAKLAPCSGKSGGAVSFDGTIDYHVEIPTTGMKPTEGAVAFWTRLTGSQTGVRYFFGHTSTPTFEFRDRIQLYMNSDDTRLDVGLGDNYALHHNVETLSVDTWYHITLTWNRGKYTIYVDGIEKAAGTYTGLKNLQSMAHIGNNGNERVDEAFQGFIDEVAIFAQALSYDEVVTLYSEGVMSLVDPTLYKLNQAIQRAEVTADKDKPKTVIALLGKKLIEAEQWEKKNPNKSNLFSESLFSRLYFLLAKAKETVGVPKEDIANLYKHVIEQSVVPDINSLSRQGAALLWLCENVKREEYEDIIKPLIQNNRCYLKAVAAKAQAMIREKKSKAAIRFLENNLILYEHWQKKHPYDEVVAKDRLPAIYFQLAKAKETVGTPPKDITDAYSKVFSSSRFDYVFEQSAALIWLLENDCASKYTEIIKSSTQNQETKTSFARVVGNICKYFESKGNWVKFEQFLDVLFAEEKSSSEWAIFVESCLSDKTTRWAKEYYKYLEKKPKVKFGVDCVVAAKHATDNKFNQAAELYRHIVDRCGPKDDKAAFEFQLCRCLFYAGEYEKASSGLDSFIANNKAKYRNLVKEAMLIKGQAYIQLGEMDKAISSFLSLITEYPEAEEAPEANFFVGYCYMLQRKFEEAADAFNLVTIDYAQSGYAAKALLYIGRITSMTE